MSTSVGNLKEASLLDIEYFIDLYSKHLPHVSHIYNFLHIARKWDGLNLESKYITIFINPEDIENGTFVAAMQFHLLQILLFTLDKSYFHLHDVLKIVVDKWIHKKILFVAIHENHRDTVYSVLRDLHKEIIHEDLDVLYWMPKETACDLNIQCPKDFCIKPLKPSDAEQINNIYTYRNEGSEDYVRTLIEVNGGHGIYSVEEDTLVAWAIRNNVGFLGMVTTVESYKRKGFGSVITKSISRQIASDGFNPVGTVLYVNKPSRQMVEKIGFNELTKVHFIRC